MRIIAAKKNSLYDVERIIMINVGSAIVYSVPKHVSSTAAFRRQRNSSISLEQLDSPQTELPIQDNHTPIIVTPDDPYVVEYLKRINVKTTQSLVLAFLLNSDDHTMIPIIFNTYERAFSFAQAYIVHQLIKKYYQKSNRRINFTFLNHLAACILNRQYIIDPDKLSEDEEWELKRMSEVFTEYGSRHSTGFVQIVCQFKIMDEESVGYLKQVFNQQILSNKLLSFKADRCHINQTYLLASLFQLFIKPDVRASLNSPSEKLQNLPFSHLQKLSLSHNYLNDDCFRVLTKLSKISVNISFINLSHNRITLFNPGPSISQIATSRLSSRISMTESMSRSPEDLPFMQFLLSLKHNVQEMYLDSNLIGCTKQMVHYLIESVNVPIKYLSVKSNKFEEVDKIKMIKYWIEDRKDRQIEDQQQKGNDKSNTSFILERKKSKSKKNIFEDFLINFGKLSIVDKQVQWYQLNLLKICRKMGYNLNIDKPTLLKSSHNSFSTVPIKVTFNTSWEICDPDDIKLQEVLAPHRKSSFLIMSRNASQANLNKKRSESLLGPELKPLTEESVKPAIAKLEKAYNTFNYSEIRGYKALLEEYNKQLYRVKIKPRFEKQQKHLQVDKKNIQAQSERVFNLIEDESEINRKLDLIVGRMLRRGINYDVYGFNNQAQNGEQQEQIILDSDGNQILQTHTSNAFPALIYLKMLRDQLIQKYLQKPSNIQQMVKQSMMATLNLPKFYLKQFQLSRQYSVASQNYEELLRVDDLDLDKRRAKLLVSVSGGDEAATDAVLRYDYLTREKCGWEHEYQCLAEIKLNPTKIVRNFSETHQMLLSNQFSLNKSFANYQPNTLPTNKIQFITLYDITINSPFGDKKLPSDYPKYPQALLPSSLPLQQLKKHAQIINNFLAFLYHSADYILSETFQYMDYIIDTLLEQSNEVAVAISNQFYLQLLSYPYSKLKEGILSTVVEYFSFYMKEDEVLQPYICAFLMKNEPNRTPDFIRRKNQDGEENLKIKKNMNKLSDALKNRIFKNLSFFVNLRIWIIQDSDQTNDNSLSKYFKKPLKFNVHLLTPINHLYNMALKSFLATSQTNDTSEYWLFLYNPTNQQTKLLTPSIASNVYDLINKGILQIWDQKYATEEHKVNSMLVFKRIVYPLQILSSKLLGGHVSKYWKYYFWEIKYNYLNYGSLLRMIDDKQQVLGLAISECIICEFLLDTVLMEAVSQFKDNTQQMKQMLLQVLEQSYFDNIQEFTPYGTKSTLNSLHYKFIKDYFVNFGLALAPIMSSIDPIKQFQIHVYKFIRICSFIGECLQLSDGISQQLLIGTTGILHVERLFTVVSIYWRQVMGVFLRKGQYGLELVIWYRKIDKKMRKIEEKKELVISDYSGSAMFLRSAIIIIRRYMLKMIQTETEQLYQLTHETQNPTEVQINLQDKRFSEVLENMIYGKANQKDYQNLSCFGEDLMPYIKYTDQFNTQLDQFGFKGQNQQNQVRSSGVRSSAEYLKDLEQRRSSLSKDPSEISNSKLIEDQKSEHRSSGIRNSSKLNNQNLFDVILEVQNEHQSPKGNKSEQRLSEVFKKQSEPAIHINEIVSEVHHPDQKQEPRKSNNLLGIQNPAQEEIVVTNARRSTRRELPKRRSSRSR